MRASGKALAAFDFKQFADLVGGKKGQGFADLLGNEKSLAVGLEGFDQPLGVGDGVCPANDAVVREQDGVVIADEGADGLSKGLGAGGFVGRDGGGADGGFVLGDEADGRARSRSWRKAVAWGGWQWTTARRHRVGAVDLEVQQQFAGAQAFAGEDVAVEIGEADVVRLHVALAHHGGGAEQKALAETDADVASVAVDILALPQLAADGDDFEAESVGLGRAGGGQGRDGVLCAAAAVRFPAPLGESESAPWLSSRVEWSGRARRAERTRPSYCVLDQGFIPCDWGHPRGYPPPPLPPYSVAKFVYLQGLREVTRAKLFILLEIAAEFRQQKGYGRLRGIVVLRTVLRPENAYGAIVRRERVIICRDSGGILDAAGQDLGLCDRTGKSPQLPRFFFGPIA